MDRNLGASQAATSSTDANSYGDLYQWGRRSDGHQCRNSATTTTLSSTDQPANGNFIVNNTVPYDWRSPQNNNLWQGVNGVNNPCPSGFRVPTSTEFDSERQSWSIQNSNGALSSQLKLPSGGNRNPGSASVFLTGSAGYYWTSTSYFQNASNLFFDSSTSAIYDYYRGGGYSVRCIKN
jgi:uncharacterized protein (TIGR02145 family)